MTRSFVSLPFVSVLLLSAAFGALAACSGNDDPSPSPSPSTGPCAGCSSTTPVGSADASHDDASPPVPDASPDAPSGDDDDTTSIACHGSFASICTDSSCIDTYSTASKATAYCETDATQVTEFPGACDGYHYISVLANGVTTNYYYDLDTGAAVAAVTTGDAGQMCLGSTASGTVPSSPCDFGGVVTVLDTLCAGGVDSGADAH